jgi:DNA repair exonuclease SbcCD ATPase subunit
MTPKAITLRSFKCFSGETRFTFPKEPGLYLVQGRNQLQPSLEGNGCGKSTLFGDAITWCLFGKTPRLLKASDIINWEAGSASSVYFEFTIEDKEYGILRTQTPNSLCLDVDGLRKNATQDQINDLLGLDFDQFVASIVFAQFGTMFFDLSATDKSTLLSAILELDVWDTATDTAKRSATQLESAINTIKINVAGIEGKVEGLQSQNFDEKINKWEQDKDEQQQDLLDQQDSFKQRLDKLLKDGAYIENKLKQHQEQLDELTEIEQEVQLDGRKLEKQRSLLQDQRNEQEYLLKNLKAELKKFENVDKTCPYCLQDVPKVHLKQEMNKLEVQIRDAFHESARFRALIDEKESELTQFKGDLLTIQQTRKEFLAEQRETLDKKSSLKADLAKLKVQQQTVERDLDKWLNAVNPYRVEQQQQQQSIAKLHESLDLYVKELQASNKELFATQYWVKGFREVRLSLISEVLTQLELEVNNKLFQLGLENWKVLFAVEGLTKGGKIKKGFTVNIVTPYNMEPVHWNAWSGGESQRLRLAGALGMSDLITAKCKQQPVFEIFDEPSSYLSEAGITSLLSILKDRARQFNKQIFLIDHRKLDTVVFDGTISVVKNHDGIVVETTW